MTLTKRSCNESADIEHKFDCLYNLAVNQRETETFLGCLPERIKPHYPKSMFGFAGMWGGSEHASKDLKFTKEDLDSFVTNLENSTSRIVLMAKLLKSIRANQEIAIRGNQGTEVCKVCNVS